jgi:sugar phosphate isomerase/epimerase
MPKIAPIEPKNTRRDFLCQSAFLTIGLVVSGRSVFGAGSLLSADEKPNSLFHGVQIGAITYSFRSLPGSPEQLLQYCVNSDVSAIELMGDSIEDFAGKPVNTFKAPPRINGQRAPLTEEQKKQVADYQKQVADWRAVVSMDKFEEIRKMYHKAGVSIYAFKPNALNANNTDAEVEYALRAAKALGARSVTVELPTDPLQTQRLGDFGAKHKIYIGYHAHLQATDTAWDTALAQSPYNSMNLDCGHYIAAGGNNTKESLLALIEAKHDRISSIHIKDRQSKEHSGNNKVWGEGDTPLQEILGLLKQKKYKFPATIELEYDIPAGSDPVQETRKCVEYAKKILDA